MINKNALQQRTLHTTMDSASFLTSRTATVMDGTTQHIYIGSAHPGSDENDPVWMILRVSLFADESTFSLFPDGQARFNQIWTNRTNLSYS